MNTLSRVRYQQVCVWGVLDDSEHKTAQSIFSPGAVLCFIGCECALMMWCIL